MNLKRQTERHGEAGENILPAAPCAVIKPEQARMRGDRGFVYFGQPAADVLFVIIRSARIDSRSANIVSDRALSPQDLLEHPTDNDHSGTETDKEKRHRSPIGPGCELTNR